VGGLFNNAMKEQGYIPGWIPLDPSVARSEFKFQYSERPGSKQPEPEVNFDDGSNEVVVVENALVKIGGNSTPELPFWHSKEATNAGLQVVYAIDGFNSLATIDGMLLVRHGFLYEPETRCFKQSTYLISKPVFDLPSNTPAYSNLREAGIPSLFLNELLKQTDKSQTRAIAQECSLNSPRMIDLANIQVIDAILDEIKGWDCLEVVLKPHSGHAGQEVKFFTIGDSLLEQALALLLGNNYTIEERITTTTLIIENVAHDWNVRAVIVEGEFLGWYVRASSSEGPVNVSLGAFVLTKKELSQYLPVYTELDEVVVQACDAVANKFPNGTVAVDLIFDQKGNAHLMEVNVGCIVCTSYPDYIWNQNNLTENERVAAASALKRGVAKAALRNTHTPYKSNIYETMTDIDLDKALRYIENLYSASETTMAIMCSYDYLEMVLSVLKPTKSNTRQGNDVCGIVSRYHLRELRRICRVGDESATKLLVEDIDNAINSANTKDEASRFDYSPRPLPEPNAEYCLYYAERDDDIGFTPYYLSRALMLEPRHNRITPLLKKYISGQEFIIPDANLTEQDIDDVVSEFLGNVLTAPENWTLSKLIIIVTKYITKCKMGLASEDEKNYLVGIVDKIIDLHDGDDDSISDAYNYLFDILERPQSGVHNYRILAALQAKLELSTPH
jgi:glutathione synthase/RimK-type ligase-like ATP-grasp enzyme